MADYAALIRATGYGLIVTRELSPENWLFSIHIPMLEIMTLYVNLSIVAYLLVSLALFTMEQGLQKTIQPHFYGKLTHLFSRGHIPVSSLGLSQHFANT